MEKIYAIGGWNPCPVNVTEEYDPATNTWTTKAAMPTARMFFGIATYRGKIFAMGGKTGLNATNATQVYDPATNNWTKKSAMPIGCYELTANVVNGKIYLIGGARQLNSAIRCINATQVYDPATDTLITETPIPTPVFGYASTVVGKKIYIISGNMNPPNTTITNLTQIYDTETQTWSTGASIPIPMNSAAAISTEGASPQIYVMGGGGTDLHEPYNLTQIYDPQNNSWSAGASMPTSSFTLGLCVSNATVYAVGGANNLTARSEVYKIPLSSVVPEFPNVEYLAPCLIVVAVAAVIIKRGSRKKRATI
jgi:N-acetylneuraminic acid mutarotase